MSQSKFGKILRYINYRMRVTIQDGRSFVGTFLAFDKKMNMVLADCEEYRKPRASSKPTYQEIPGITIDTEQKRTLGLVVLRGENVVSLQVAGPPPSHKPHVYFAGNPAMPGVLPGAPNGQLGGLMPQMNGMMPPMPQMNGMMPPMSGMMPQFPPMSGMMPQFPPMGMGAPPLPPGVPQ